MRSRSSALTDTNNPTAIANLSKEIASDPVTKELSNMLKNTTTHRVADLLSSLSSNSTPQTAINRQQSPYLAAAKLASPNATVKALPKLIPGKQSAPLPPTDRIDPKLQAQMRRSINGVFGHERKTFVRITTERGDPFAKASDLRFALKQGGLPTPVSIIKTSNPRVAYALAQKSGAKVMSEAFHHTRNIAASLGRDIPTLQFDIKQDLLSDCDTPEVIRSILPHRQAETERLECDECYWSPSYYYANSMRDEHAKLLHKLKNLEPSAQEAPLQPRPPQQNPAPRTPRNKRQHDNVSTGDTPETARARLGGNSQTASPIDNVPQSNTTHMDVDGSGQAIAQPVQQHQQEGASTHET